MSTVFSALGSPVRRQVLAQLGRGPATVGELGAPLDVGLPTLSKHLDVLEGAGLVTRTRSGRTTRCAVVPGALDDAQEWLLRQRLFWSGGLDRLTAHLEEQP